MDRLPMINLVSGICSALMLSLCLTIGINRPHRTTRVSLRLQAAIAFVNMSRSFQAAQNYKIGDSICTFIGFVTSLYDHLYLFLNVAIAVNLHKVQLRSQHPGPRWEPFLWATAFLSAILINGLAFAIGAFGRTRFNTCAILSSTTIRLVGKIFLQYLITFPCILYCLSISLCILFQREPQMPRTSPPARRTACIVAIALIVCVITFTSNLVNELALDFSEEVSPLLRYITYTLTNATGVLTLLVFILDPGFHSAFGSYPYSGFEPKPKSGIIRALTSSSQSDISAASITDPTTFNQYMKCKNLL